MKKFFQGLSITQILAGALAAVTSFLLAAKIGIAGSVIGVAVGSIVSAVASQIYQNVFKESSKKIQTTPQEDSSQDAVQDAGEGSSEGADETVVAGADETAALSATPNPSGTDVVLCPSPPRSLFAR